MPFLDKPSFYFLNFYNDLFSCFVVRCPGWTVQTYAYFKKHTITNHSILDIKAMRRISCMCAPCFQRCLRTRSDCAHAKVKLKTDNWKKPYAIQLRSSPKEKKIQRQNCQVFQYGVVAYRTEYENHWHGTEVTFTLG